MRVAATIIIALAVVLLLWREISRANRDIDLCEDIALVLKLLRDGAPRYEADIFREANRQLRCGRIYITLARMENVGLVESEKEVVHESSCAMPRRIYRITERGRELLAVT